MTALMNMAVCCMCAGEKNITSDVEVVSADYTNTAMNRMIKGDVKYRFVIDVQGTMLNSQ